MGRVGAWLRRLLRAVPSDELDGIRLEGPSWEVAGRDVDPAEFFRALGRLVPDGSILFLEGGVHPAPLQAFLERHALAPEAKLALGTAWPRATLLHVPATSPFLGALAEIAQTCAAPELCAHLHVYRGHSVLLQWYDAFIDPFYVSKRLGRDSFAAFCRELKASWKDAAPPGS